MVFPAQTPRVQRESEVGGDHHLQRRYRLRFPQRPHQRFGRCLLPQDRRHAFARGRAPGRQLLQLRLSEHRFDEEQGRRGFAQLRARADQGLAPQHRVERYVPEHRNHGPAFGCHRRGRCRRRYGQHGPAPCGRLCALYLLPVAAGLRRRRQRR